MPTSKIRWAHFPRWCKPPDAVREVVEVFEKAQDRVSSATNKLKSNEVLGHVRAGLEALKFRVEAGKSSGARVAVPVLFGEGGRAEKSFHADAYHEEHGIVVEVEAGRAYTNNQFLKDLFQACVMADVCHLVIAVRQDYRGTHDYEEIKKFFETLFASPRLRLPLEGLTLIGY